MGQTPVYKLPWAEPTDVADGPYIYQKFAQAAEDGINNNIPNIWRFDSGYNSPNPPSVGNWATITGWRSFYLGHPCLMTLDADLSIVTEGPWTPNAGGRVHLYIDEVKVRDLFWHTRYLQGTTVGGSGSCFRPVGTHRFEVAIFAEPGELNSPLTKITANWSLTAMNVGPPA